MPSVKKASKAIKPARKAAEGAIESESDSDSDGIDQTIGSVSDSDSDPGPSSGSDEEASDSDSLDSSEPRKRRRTSAEEPRSPERVASFKPTFSAPSRIKRTQQQQESATLTKDPKFDTTTTGVTAPVDHNTTFDSLGVSPWLVHSLASMAIKRPTGIQKGCIPEILKGKDCIGGSRTGSGKTVAFAVPILQQWAKDPRAIYALILTPTR